MNEVSVLLKKRKPHGVPTLDTELESGKEAASGRNCLPQGRTPIGYLVPCEL